MTDNKERTIKDILNDEIERKLAENPPKVPTLEEFKAMAYERLEEKKAENTEAEADAEARTVVANTKTDKKRKLYIACGAVGFVIAVMLCAFAINMFTTDVGADKNPKDEIVTEDGVIIEDGGWGSSEEEDNVWIIKDWKYVVDAKDIVPKILVPEYIPNDYDFESLRIETFDSKDVFYEYKYVKYDSSPIEIEVFDTKNDYFSLNIDKTTRTVECKVGTIYIFDDKIKIATIKLNDGVVVNIYSQLSDEKIVELINNLSN